MTQWLKSLRLLAVVPAVLVIALEWSSLSQVRGQTITPPTAQSVPYSTEVRPEIASLMTAPLAPQSMSDLKAIQTRVEEVVRQALPATVAILVPPDASGNGAQGSGVIVSKDGYVLTAGHVSGKPGTRLMVVLSNGARVTAQSLGANNGIDSGMIKITREGDYPFVPMGITNGLKTGQWVVAIGHPGGYQSQRPPVARLGRVLQVKNGPSGYVATDCPLISGDSGGPMFDLDGRLIAINSRIGLKTTENLHVPIDTFIGTWDRLAKGDQWGRGLQFANRGGPADAGSGSPSGTKNNSVAKDMTVRLGIQGDDAAKGVQITSVSAGTAAEDAGLLMGDIVTKLDGVAVKSFEQLSVMLSKHKPGDEVKIEYLRNNRPAGKTVTLKAAE